MLPYELTDLPNRDVALLRRLAARRDREIDQALELLAEAVGLCGRFKAERDDLDGELEALRGKLGRGGRKTVGTIGNPCRRERPGRGFSFVRARNSGL